MERVLRLLATAARAMSDEYGADDVETDRDWLAGRPRLDGHVDVVAVRDSVHELGVSPDSRGAENTHQELNPCLLKSGTLTDALQRFHILSLVRD